MVNAHLLTQTLPSPLHRLHVYDGLTMNARRWDIAHNYHRRRQNLHFQALFEAGIVSGLGIHLIDPPDASQAQYRQKGRWMQIQPGIAIDGEGNPIIVDRSVDRTFRLAIEPPRDGRITVYVVISFVEPHLNGGTTPDTLPEQFRLDQKTTPPTPLEVELCRFTLQAEKEGQIALKPPEDVLFPGLNELDLRYRQPVRLAPQEFIRIGVASRSEKLYNNLVSLNQALPNLYPPLGSQVKWIPNEAIGRNLSNSCDLLCLETHFLSDLNSGDTEFFQRLRDFMNGGGMVLMNSSTRRDGDYLRSHISQHLQRPLKTWDELRTQHHPLLTDPFPFSLQPAFRENLCQLFLGHQFIWIEGPLSAAWGNTSNHLREEIRTAQELGINLLRLAWRQRQLLQLCRA